MLNPKITNFKKRLKDKEVVIMDGATGTEIQRRGVKTTLPLWSADALISNPVIVNEIHSDYITNGAEIIITNTFRTTERTLNKVGIKGKAFALTEKACNLAKAAVIEINPEHDIYIAGSIAPLEDCYSPDLTPVQKELDVEHSEYAKNVFGAGVDFLLIETMITIRETLSAVKAAKNINAPFGVSFCINTQGQLLSGEPLKTAIKQIETYDPLFIGINCIPLDTASAIVPALQYITDYPLCVYANGDGHSDEDEGWKFDESNKIEDYVDHAKNWLKNGVQIIGGCCGTSPLYIKHLIKYKK